jgi:uncharacterized protein
MTHTALIAAPLALTAGSVVGGIAGSLREALFMFWDTLWALILGFGLSGAVQAFVPAEALRARLGNHRPAAVTRASAAGAVSSSCSYAASAMAKSLFAKGADFVTSLIFMFAATNLVIELGIVLVVLIGWQFAAAEYVGGIIMIILLALVGGVFLAGRQVRRARARLAGAPGDGDPASHDAGHGGDVSPAPAAIRTASGWAGAATFAIADLRMLRREIAIGFVAAGVLAVAVPASFWNAFFLSGHGVWTSIENAVVGPFVAMISFVCSIGNVPLAAALWKGGISFGGVVSFIFADLIALPLLLIYRKFYGTKLALKMLGTFWIVMSAAGLATEAIFGALGLVPAGRPAHLVADRFTFNYTTVLNIAFLVILAVLYWLYRNRERLGAGRDYAIDPVCGMQVTKASAPMLAVGRSEQYWFCSDRCRERFASDPARRADSVSATP